MDPPLFSPSLTSFSINIFHFFLVVGHIIKNKKRMPDDDKKEEDDCENEVLKPKMLDEQLKRKREPINVCSHTAHKCFLLIRPA